MQKSSFYLVALFFTTLFLSSCSGDVVRPQVITPTPAGTYEVAPIFREFYNYLGGEAILGPAISPPYQENGIDYQFTENAKMAFDPAAPANWRFKLAPLASELNLRMPTSEPPQDGQVTGGRFISGFFVPDDFLPYYDKLLGTRFTGDPLTPVHFNPEKNRQEQYFENVGFYRIETTEGKEVGLLSYGAWRCDVDCRSAPPANSLVVVTSRIDPAFEEKVQELGADLTGFALSEAYQAADGKLEQIFENVVLSAGDANGEQVDLRPVAEAIGMLPDPLEDPASQADAYFYPIQTNKGYNIPLPFVEYIIRRGGVRISGPPVGQALASEGGALRQCFTRLCLTYHPSAPEGQQVHPEPLGYTYKQLLLNAVPKGSSEASPTKELIVQVWESSPMIPPDQEQEIGVSVYEGDQPKINVTPVLTLELPGGSEQTYVMQTTSTDGQTHLHLPPISAPNGTLIPYQVCINSQSGVRFCVRESYMIWETP